MLLLTGTHPRTLDDKKRLTLPKRIREQLGEPSLLHAAPGPERSLWLYTQETLEQQATRLANDTGEDVTIFRRLYFASIESLELDRLGRLLLPDRLIQFAGLHTDVVLLGVCDHLELWDSGTWQQYQETHRAKLESILLK